MEGLTKFQLSDTAIKFEYPIEGSGATAGPNSNKLNITSIPVVFTDTTYSVSGTSWYENWGVSTDINVSHKGDTLLVKELGSSVSDKRVEAITTLVSAAEKALPLFAAGIPDTSQILQHPPSGILVSRLLSSPPKNCTKLSDHSMKCTKVELEGGFILKDSSPKPYLADIDIDAPPAGSFERKKINFPHKTHTFVYSACRTLHIRVTNDASPGFVAESSQVVADPAWLESLALPSKGKISTGSSCGADSVAQDSNLPGATEYINALVGAGKTIKDALDKQNKSGVK
ncbi:MAG: hypothetical protein KAY79_02140 [Nitrospira sp.]|nr:hypothetical protein [Nitrospira sp.]